ncbi:YutD family protein [Planococcus sp. CAU13]|uniref:YutD family protein n=1 Tax=Planococcus sp. CAU13 TaxID=1541197 RepID=UPI00052FFEF1|nr:YutD family protein [Planococcus sp. CAU13]
MITIDQWNYEIVIDYRNGFQEEAINNRYSEILGKYDYILGDWGYGQLRLKGFFEDTNHKASYDTKISTLQDYLYEYCNFGCAYFVIKKTGKAQVPAAEPAEEPSEQINETETDEYPVAEA